MANREQNNPIPLYVTSEEKELIRKVMNDAGINNMGASLRKMAIDGCIFLLDDMSLKDMNLMMTRFVFMLV